MASTAYFLDFETPQPSSPTALPVLELPRKEPQPGFNRRFMPRVKSLFAARALGQDMVFRGIDLSVGGMLCVAAEPIWPGNRVDFELFLGASQHADTVPVSGIVVELVAYRGRTAMRVRFDEMSAPNRKRIATWMARSRAGE